MGVVVQFLDYKLKKMNDGFIPEHFTIEDRPFRIINDDLSHGDRLEIVDYFETYEEAYKKQEELYFFMTSIQEYKDSQWVFIEGLTEDLVSQLE